MNVWRKKKNSKFMFNETNIDNFVDFRIFSYFCFDNWIFNSLYFYLNDTNKCYLLYFNYLYIIYSHGILIVLSFSCPVLFRKFKWQCSTIGTFWGQQCGKFEGASAPENLPHCCPKKVPIVILCQTILNRKIPGSNVIKFRACNH